MNHSFHLAAKMSCNIEHVVCIPFIYSPRENEAHSALPEVLRMLGALVVKVPVQSMEDKDTSSFQAA